MVNDIGFFQSRLEDCLCLEDQDQRKREWHLLFADMKEPDKETLILQLIMELKNKIRAQQSLGEEHQTLLNQWQRSKDEAQEMLDAYHQQMEQVRRELEKTKWRMSGFEKQFVILQEAAREAKASLEAVKKERDQAWEQFRNREEQLEQVTAELNEVRADRTAAWEQFTEREKQLDELRRASQEN